MGKTFRDRHGFSLPRVPPIQKRSEPFKDKRRQHKYPADVQKEWDDPWLDSEWEDDTVGYDSSGD